MITKEKLYLHAFLTRSPHWRELIRYLPLQYKEPIDGWTDGQSCKDTHLLLSNGWIKHIHFSWFITPLKELAREIKLLFLSILTDEQRGKLYELFNLSGSHIYCSPIMRPFLANALRLKIYQKMEIVSENCLPPSECNVLLSLERNFLLNLMDLLGVYDLSANLRHVIDGALLQKVHSSISKSQLLFLNYCSKQPTKWPSNKLDLSKWDGTKHSLQHMLHSMGLARFGKALALEDESFKWHILHHLDTGRASVVEEAMKQKQDSVVHNYFKNQVLHIVRQYKT